MHGGCDVVADDSANCPQDQPISTCKVKSEQRNYTVTLNCGLEALEGPVPAGVFLQQLVFDSTRGGVSRDLYVVSSDGTDMRRLTHGEADSPGDDFAPAWSPSGRQIVFVSDRDREPGIYDLHIMDADGSAVTRLTNDERA